MEGNEDADQTAAHMPSYWIERIRSRLQGSANKVKCLDEKLKNGNGGFARIGLGSRPHYNPDLKEISDKLEQALKCEVKTLEWLQSEGFNHAQPQGDHFFFSDLCINQFVK